MKKKIKLSWKEGSAPAPKVSAALLQALLFDKKSDDDKVVISFILTEANKEPMSEKLITVLRIAQSMLTTPGNRFYDKANSDGKKKMLVTELPIVKNEELPATTPEDISNGFGERVKVHEVEVKIDDFEEIKPADIETISVSVKETTLPDGTTKLPKSAGSTASRVLRTLVGDNKKCAVDFVLTKFNAQKMCEKILSIERITRRMQNDPGSIIFASLPSKRIDYKITVIAPILKMVPARNREKEALTTVNEIVFRVK